MRAHLEACTLCRGLCVVPARKNWPLKDSRKHKGANVAGVKKTTSGKSQRVGAAGKKAVAAKVASRAE